MLMTVTVVAVNGWIWLLVVVGLGMYYDIVDCMPLSIFWILPSALTQRVFFFVIVFAELPFIDDFHSFLESFDSEISSNGRRPGKVRSRVASIWRSRNRVDVPATQRSHEIFCCVFRVHGPRCTDPRRPEAPSCAPRLPGTVRRS